MCFGEKLLCGLCCQWSWWSSLVWSVYLAAVWGPSLHLLLQVGCWYHSLLCWHCEHSQAHVHRSEDGTLFKQALPAAGTGDRSANRYWKCHSLSNLWETELKYWHWNMSVLLQYLKARKSCSKTIHMELIRCKGMSLMYSEWGEEYQMGKLKADYLQIVTVCMLSVTWADTGEFSQGHEKYYCSDWSELAHSVHWFISEKEKVVNRSTEAQAQPCLLL